MDMTGEKAPRSLRQNLLVLLAYTILTVIMTWPIAGRLGSHIPASAGDAWVHLWTFRWIKQALLTGVSPYYTDLLFYPDGVSLFFHNIAWANIAIWLPLQAIIGEAAAYSIVFLTVIVLNGFGGYLLAREFIGSSLAGFVAGLIVAFWPYTLSHHSHPNLIFIAWIPLALLYLKRFFDHGRKRDAFLTALFIAFIGLTRWQLLVMGGFLIGLYIIWRLISDNSVRNARVFGLLAVIALLALIIMTPLLAPVAYAQLTRDDPDSLFVDRELASTDLLAYLIPNRYHPLWGEAAFKLYDNFSVNQVLVAFVGYTVFLLAVYSVVTRWPESRFWLFAVLFYVLLALGPTLTINGYSLPIPMPYRLVQDLFLVKIIRMPDRLNVILSIPVAMLAAYGFDALRQIGYSRRWTLGLSIFIGLLILAETIVSYPIYRLDTPDWYTELGQEPGQFGILNVPLGLRERSDKAFMFYQAVHGKPIVEGHISRPPLEAFSFIERVPLLSSLSQGSKSPPVNVDVFAQLRQLSDANIRYLILHHRFLSDEEISAWRDWLIQDPVHEDEDLVVFATDPKIGETIIIDQDMKGGPDDQVLLSLIEANVAPDRNAQGGTILIKAAWANASADEWSSDVCISLFDFSHARAQSQCSPLIPDLSISQLSAGHMATAEYGVELSPYLKAGVYTVTLALADIDNDATLSDSATIGSIEISAISRDFKVPEPSTDIHTTWADQIYLPGYDISQSGTDSLYVTFYWQALHRMPTSYTNYLHLISSATGQIVAQADVIPRGWTYPTNWWEQGEFIEDRVHLSLKDVPPGKYELYVGWYDAETGERLAAFSEIGEAYPDDMVRLTTFENRP